MVTGRHTYKLYINSNTHYVMDLLCDIPIAIGSEENLLHEMAQTPELFAEFRTDLANAFAKLMQSFGTPSYVESMRDFTRTLTAEAVLTKPQKHRLCTNFVHELTHELHALFHQEDLPAVLFAIKILFLDPRIKCTPEAAKRPQITLEKVIIFGVCECGFDEVDEKSVMKQQETEVLVLQKHVRRFLVRNLLSYHKEAHKKHMEVALLLLYAYLLNQI